jgi:hypothetical protein
MTGVFTRDYRENEQFCQILVTVPQCLQILLFSANNMEWASRIKYIILDEVHLIGEAGGEVWEHIVLYSNAPFLALSATLGNTDRFEEWLGQVERVRGRRLVVVKHDERWNDLKTWIYSPGSSSTIVPLNACSFVRPVANTYTLEDSLKLLPEDCSLLYQAMLCTLPPEQTAHLAPEVFFSNHAEVPETILWGLSMRDVEKWAIHLRSAFNSLSPSVQSQLLSLTSTDSHKALQRADEGLDKVGQDKYLGAHVYNLAQQLKSNDLLPAICFHMSRNNCEHLAKTIVSELMKQEREAKKLEGWADTKAKLLYQLDLLKSQDLKCFNGTLDEFEDYKAQMSEEMNQIQSKLDKMSQVDKRFTLFPVDVDQITESEIFESLNGNPKYVDLPHWLLVCLLRGVAVHHSGMNKKHRQLVETLFRKKRVAAVFATGTLALGINMPCKTSVFVGDAVYINAMTFRQMAGRAGRRGFDLRGNIVFCGMRSTKIIRLMNSKLPVLQGNQILSSSTVLRMLMMYSASHKYGSNKTRHVKDSIKRMIDLPLNSVPLASQQAAHIFRFCVDHMCKEGMLFQDSEEKEIKISSLAGLIAHLHYVEPANFAFFLIITSGAFEEYCRPGMEREVVGILSHLFNPRPLAPFLSIKSRQQRGDYGPSVVQLPKLPDLVVKALDEYNKRTREVLIDYQTCFVKCFESDLGQDNLLPFSCLRHAVATQTADLSQVKLPSQTYSVVSSFVALSGGNDNFDSVELLCANMRQGLFLDADMVPVYELSERPLNAYYLDFFKHGQISALVEYNHIHKDDVWEALKDFKLILKALWAALKRRRDDWGETDIGSSTVIQTLKNIIEEFSAKLDDQAA